VHCRLSLSRDGRLQVEDLGSTNGTFVNSRPIDRATPLSGGDTVRVGRVTFSISRADHTAT
jgi:pSer/pThr/pTyr-binding forkhead associated (FHA) protein